MTDKLVGVFTFTKSDNDFEIKVRERQVRMLQAAAPAAAANETSPEQMALKLGNQAVVFFTVLILLLALLLSVRLVSAFPLPLLLEFIGGAVVKIYQHDIYILSQLPHNFIEDGTGPMF